LFSIYLYAEAMILEAIAGNRKELEWELQAAPI
jgi:hypothetical protein